MKWWIVMVIALVNAGPAWAQDTASEKARVQGVLRRAIEEKEQEAARKAALTNQTLRADPGFRDMEERYLKGEITAKQFRKYLHDYKPPASMAPLVPNSPTLDRALEMLRQHDPSAPNAGRPPKPFGDHPAAETNAPAVDLEDLESKMNRLVESKKQREQTNQLDASKLDLLEPGSGLARRERLDLLLRLYIEGVITEPEYRVHREKILAEPDPKPAAK